MRVLMIVGWDLQKVEKDDISIQSANLLIKGRPYWFFKYWPVDRLEVEVVGIKEVPLLTFLEKKFLKFRFSALSRFFVQNKYDVIICFHSFIGLPFAFFTALLRFRKQAVPFVLIDVEGIGRKCYKLLLPLLKISLRSISSIFYLASIQKEDYNKFLPELSDRSMFLPWGVDLSRYPLENIKDSDYIVTIGYQGNDFRDWRTLIDAFRGVSPAYKVKLLVIGRTSFTIKESGSESSVANIEFAGRLKLDRLNRLVSGARFVVLPLPERRHAYAQMTLLGCMALGKAVVVSDVSAVRDYVVDGETAVLTKPNDSEHLRQKIEFFLKNPEFATRIGRKASESARSQYTEEIMSKIIFERVSSLIKKS